MEMADGKATPYAASIWPFYDFKKNIFGHILRNFNLSWRPIFELPDACPGLHWVDPIILTMGWNF
jgi:hypothetical protein